ncbi:replication initiator protein A [Erysipelothrix rhusiopathiae]|nr:replication initiator protein A [Erysipelothrix rhusiopathiae]MDE8180956.1 replication initiator protein A [Erysipelothrix rhusiopathiae]
MIPKRRRFNVSDVVNSTFYQVPKFLFTEEFKELNSDARLLYGMLKDRHELSLKNKWLTDDGDVYLIYTRQEMMKMLGVSNKTVIKAMEALKAHGLLEEVRQGLRKPNLIFMYMVEGDYLPLNDRTVDEETKENSDNQALGSSVNREEIPEVENLHFKKCKNYTSRSEEITLQEVENLHPINTYNNQSSISNTDLSNTDNLSINQESTNHDGLMDKYNEFETLVKKNINFYDLLQVYDYRHDEITELLKIIVGILVSDDNELIRINGKPLPSQMVKARMLELRYEHIQYVFDSLDNVTNRIKNIRSYLVTTLYNAPETIGSYYGAKARETLGTGY